MSYTSINCPHCHEDRVGARITSGAQLPDEDNERRYFFVAVCRKCGFPAIIVARRTGTRLADGPPLVKHVCRTERDPIPNFIEPLKMIPEAGGVAAPDGLPANVASAFSEALDCIQRGAINSGAMGLRLTLERATRALDCDPNQQLDQRIAALASKHSVPATLEKWAGETPLICGGMDASDDDPAEDELQNARRFTEMFLTCAFTLPSRIDQRRSPADAQNEDESAASEDGNQELMAGSAHRL
jgi:hypothetical protein